MKIEVINLSKNQNSDSKLKGSASIILNDSLMIHNVRIISSDPDNWFVAMPMTKNKEGEFVDLVHPTNIETRNKITDAVLNAYDGQLSKIEESEKFHVTDVNITKIEHPKLRAIATVLFNDMIAMHQVYIVENEPINQEPNYGVVLPAIVVNEQKTDVVEILNKDLGEEVLKKVIRAYYEK